MSKVSRSNSSHRLPLAGVDSCIEERSFDSVPRSGILRLTPPGNRRVTNSPKPGNADRVRVPSSVAALTRLKLRQHHFPAGQTRERPRKPARTARTGSSRAAADGGFSSPAAAGSGCRSVVKSDSVIPSSRARFLRKPNTTGAAKDIMRAAPSELRPDSFSIRWRPHPASHRKGSAATAGPHRIAATRPRR